MFQVRWEDKLKLHSFRSRSAFDRVVLIGNLNDFTSFQNKLHTSFNMWKTTMTTTTSGKKILSCISCSSANLHNKEIVAINWTRDQARGPPKQRRKWTKYKLSTGEEGGPAPSTASHVVAWWGNVLIRWANVGWKSCFSGQEVSLWWVLSGCWLWVGVILFWKSI